MPSLNSVYATDLKCIWITMLLLNSVENRYDFCNKNSGCVRRIIEPKWTANKLSKRQNTI